MYASCYEPEPEQEAPVPGTTVVQSRPAKHQSRVKLVFACKAPLSLHRRATKSQKKNPAEYCTTSETAPRHQRGHRLYSHGTEPLKPASAACSAEAECTSSEEHSAETAKWSLGAKKAKQAKCYGDVRRRALRLRTIPCPLARRPVRIWGYLKGVWPHLFGCVFEV
jgi:hypothetical protein